MNFGSLTEFLSPKMTPKVTSIKKKKKTGKILGFRGSAQRYRVLSISVLHTVCIFFLRIIPTINCFLVLLVEYLIG